MYSSDLFKNLYSSRMKDLASGSYLKGLGGYGDQSSSDSGDEEKEGSDTTEVVSTFSGDSSDDGQELIEDMNEMPLRIRRTVYALKGVQKDIDATWKDFFKGENELLGQLKERKAPIFEHRRQIINGEVEVTPEEVAAAKGLLGIGEAHEEELLLYQQQQPPSDNDAAKFSLGEKSDDAKRGAKKGVKSDGKDEGEESGEATTTTAVATTVTTTTTPESSVNPGEEDDKRKEKKRKVCSGIPFFWVTALLHEHKSLSPYIHKVDAKALSYCTNIAMSYIDDDQAKGMVLKFEFAENPFFKNTELTKSLHWITGIARWSTSSEWVWSDDKLEGCQIDWISDKTNLCIDWRQKKQRHMYTGKTRTIWVPKEKQSFFSFFAPGQEMEDNETIYDDNFTVTSADQELDEEMTFAVKDVLKSPVSFFLGERVAKRARAKIARKKEKDPDWNWWDDDFV